MSFDIHIECRECNADLIFEAKELARAGDEVTLSIKPCEDCIKQAVADAEAELRKELEQ